MRILTVLALIVLTATAATTTAHAQAGQPWKKQIALDANISIPGGDAGEGMNTGFGGTAAFYYQLLTRVTFLSASIGWNSFDYDAAGNASTTIIPLLLGARYNFALTGFQPYIGLEFGAYLISSSSSFGDASETEVGIQPKIGFRYPLSPGLDFDASLKYHIVMSDPDFSIIAPGIGIAYTID